MNKLVDYWLFTVRTKDGGRLEDVKIFGYECPNKTDARKSALHYGTIFSVVTIYQKNDIDLGKSFNKLKKDIC